MHGQTARTIVLPFKLEIEPMVRLLVTSTKDAEFEGVEPQLFDDPVHGKGIRFLRYRRDHTVDVYWEPGVRTDPFALNAGLRDFAETVFDTAQFEITDTELHIDISFRDLQGRKVEMRVHERGSNRKDFRLLAPVGHGIKQPDKLMLVHLLGFQFAVRNRTEVQIRVGDRDLTVPALPIPFDFHRVSMMRYAPVPVVAALNPPMTRPVVGEAAVPGCTVLDGMTVTVDPQGRVSQLGAGEGAYRAEMSFEPHLPSLSDLPTAGEAGGTWQIRIADDQITGGTYHLVRRDDEVTVELHPTKRWIPVQMPWEFKLLTKVIRVFTHWPTTYWWKGKVLLAPTPSMTGGWGRRPS